MQKRKSLFSIVLVVLVLVLAVAMLVACNDPKAKYTITFDDGSEVAKTVTLEEGTALTAEQIPAAKAIDGKNFDGWYIGETLVEAGYKPTENVTAVAKYSSVQVTVRFVNGNDTTSVVVDYNTAIASDKLPADAQPADSRIYGFEGWFNGETKFVGDMTFTADTTFTAQFNRTGYIVIISNAATQPPSVERVIEMNEDGVALLPEGLLPTNVPPVENKVFLGFYNGSVKMTAGMEITDDITIEACYVGEDDYDGLWVDEENKFVALFNKDDDFICLGKANVYYSNFTFDDETGKMEYPSYSTSWSLSIIGDSMTIVKSSNSDVPVTYVLTKVTDDVDFAGEYIRKGFSDTLTVLEGGFVMVGDYSYYNPEYQYAKISENNGVYTLTVVDEDGNIQIANVAVLDNGILSVSGEVSEDGIWVKDATFKFRLYAKNGDESIIKHSVDGSYIYVYIDENGDYSLITADKEIVQDGSDIVTLTFPDNSKRSIKLSYYEYLLAGNESGTYTWTDGKDTQTLVLDGFGNATISGGGDYSFDGAISYTVKADNVIYFAELELTIQLDGDTFSILEADQFAGEYYQLNNNYYDSKLELDGFGVVTLWTGYYGLTKVVGTYTIDEQNGTITIVGVEYDDEVYDGIYEVLFDGETLSCNGTYFSKEAEDRVTLMVGTWVDSNAEYTIEITKSAYGSSIYVTFNGKDATNVVPVKYDKTVLQFEVDGDVYVISLDDSALIITFGGSVVAALHKDITIDSQFIGTWYDKDETYGLNLVIEEKKVTLNGQEASNITFDSYSLKFEVDGVNYTFYNLSKVTLDYDGLSIIMVKEKTSGGEIGGDVIISNEALYGTWTLSDADDDMTPKTGEIVISENSVTIDGIAVENLAFDSESGYLGEISFTYNGHEYVIHKTSSFASVLLVLVENDTSARMNKSE